MRRHTVSIHCPRKQMIKKQASKHLNQRFLQCIHHWEWTNYSKRMVQAEKTQLHIILNFARKECYHTKIYNDFVGQRMSQAIHNGGQIVRHTYHNRDNAWLVVAANRFKNTSNQNKYHNCWSRIRTIAKAFHMGRVWHQFSKPIKVTTEQKTTPPSRINAWAALLY